MVLFAIKVLMIIIFIFQICESVALAIFLVGYKFQLHPHWFVRSNKVYIIQTTTNVTNKIPPINIKIKMSNSAGVFQIDELLKPRIVNSGLQPYFHVIAEITGEKESRIIEKFEI